MSIIPSAPPNDPTPDVEIRAAVAKLRKHVKHATDGPWVTSSVWSPRATCTSAVYSHAHPAGSVESEVVASGRIKSGYGGIREPWNAEYIALMQPDVGGALADLLDDLADGDDEGFVNPWALGLARQINGAKDGAE
ncbi:hypothetical protein [Streptomyces sp. OR43]|uniref:hypothetical protein n=1 Tax=Streptomyces sp. or43 TaxID=2478957 RepID=UPI0011CE76D2|nr:hypothetical protein [Streptomyces sp. or43]TXS48898.1 hypothetical protein EAO72_02790 [Streptomyces sp. or43]